MIQSPQLIRASLGSAIHTATVAWAYENGLWMVTVDSTEFGRIEARENDAFEALCLVREQLEPQGWRLGVAGAQADVWPSGMARDQGGGLRAYRFTEHGPDGLVDTFDPVDPATVTTVAEQRAAYERQWR